MEHGEQGWGVVINPPRSPRVVRSGNWEKDDWVVETLLGGCASGRLAGLDGLPDEGCGHCRSDARCWW